MEETLLNKKIIFCTPFDICLLTEYDFIYIINYYEV